MSEYEYYQELTSKLIRYERALITIKAYVAKSENECDEKMSILLDIADSALKGDD